MILIFLKVFLFVKGLCPNKTFIAYERMHCSRLLILVQIIGLTVFIYRINIFLNFVYFYINEILVSGILINFRRLQSWFYFLVKKFKPSLD